jgi:pantoate--beta-alanine ligase
MELFRTVQEFKEVLKREREAGKTVGFVPTMGALHQGHLSLVAQASAHCSCVVVSIFVNPTQFNNPADLQRYPRDLEADRLLLENKGCHYIFAPSVEEIYPVPDIRKFEFGKLDKVMEGEHRPGHFNGVAQVVSKLFDIVEPDKAFFGLKDFQQLAIIKNLVTQLAYKIEIIPCPIVREPDGLAMSSRNKLLTSEQRINAAHISKVVFKAKEMVSQHTLGQVKEWVIKTINENPFLRTEYFEIVDDTFLEPKSDWEPGCNIVGCIAVYCGEVRLIDNVSF